MKNLKTRNEYKRFSKHRHSKKFQASTENRHIYGIRITALKPRVRKYPMGTVEDEDKKELLTFLQVFKRKKVLGFSYEQKNSKWSLFIHLSTGVIQISGDKQYTLKDAVYASLIIDTIPCYRK